MPLFSLKKSPRDQRGFTLPEVLTTVTIIGLLASIGTVSYDGARASARDVKRVSDLKQIQTAVEFYFENHGTYPDDGRAGDEGMVLGLPETSVLSDAGFGPDAQGVIYMAKVPKNPEPGGSPYVYRSLDPTGTNCVGDCGTYAMLFTLERKQGSYEPGPHAITPIGVAGAEGGAAGAGVARAGGSLIGVEGAQATLERAAVVATGAVAEFVQDPTVRAVSSRAVAPAAAATAVVNTVAVAAANTALTATSFGGYLLLLLAQPFGYVFRRKRKAWGTVYNTLSRLGEDLVILRLRDSSSGRIVRSTVTDGDGRFSFVAPQGRYRVEASKPGYTFPSALTRGMRDDGPFPYLYHGQEIEIGPNGALVTPNIPLDPPLVSESDADIRRKMTRRRLRRSFSEWSLIAGALACAITPTLFVAFLFVLQLLSYFLFRRLAAISESRRWGIVFDQATRKPVPYAIARVFEARFNKMLDSQATDSSGRYHFRVGGNVYYLTVSKDGYHRTETAPIDLSKSLNPTVIASDLPLAPHGSAKPDTAPVAPDVATEAVEAKTVVVPDIPPTSEARPDQSKWLNSL